MDITSLYIRVIAVIWLVCSRVYYLLHQSKDGDDDALLLLSWNLSLLSRHSRHRSDAKSPYPFTNCLGSIEVGVL
ncbi:hypothetical protein ASPWEDRAFT_41064 [Aspergillus wentii DTO 134E9]|uniref:Uncharacterized protein n=1 Tax=Aspergillus wentii DTO 134E9 TaxID=1073089 RepID=A0A1L9RLM2_ASPWE|nr:uncharacterized protein ASPWEDRAFT_41064 [Aspergillus wentii DTO 134E9]OJJ35822.1 hypothetical protein ASPWEDRAFT_41064 [Aspergillus wentii DTO 134E9]